MRATITIDPRTECILLSFVVDDLQLATGSGRYAMVGTSIYYVVSAAL